MCWSGEASTAMAAVGFVGAAFELQKALVKDPITKKSELEVDGHLSKHALRAFTLFYFSLMEALQAWNYIYLDKPGPMNALGSFLGFVHISFQPIPTILFAFSFLPKKRRAYWFAKGTSIAAVSSVAFLFKAITNPTLPGCFAAQCIPGDSVLGIIQGHGVMGCSPGMVFRSYPGEWHIAWQWALNSCGWVASAGYTFVAFCLPALAGGYRIMLYSFALGPFLAYFLTGNSDEWAAIWCLLSIGFLSVAKIPIINRFMTVEHESWVDTFAWLRQVAGGLVKKMGVQIPGAAVEKSS
jgi:hypothetical protein